MRKTWFSLIFTKILKITGILLNFMKFWEFPLKSKIFLPTRECHKSTYSLHFIYTSRRFQAFLQKIRGNHCIFHENPHFHEKIDFYQNIWYFRCFGVKVDFSAPPSENLHNCCNILMVFGRRACEKCSFQQKYAKCADFWEISQNSWYFSLFQENDLWNTKETVTFIKGFRLGRKKCRI